ncbi:Predicted DNA binding protein, contains HTH domain [Halobiforma haloterrestris]|uniref:Predicted DNA binding protein, contains HTH domain n=1 Tax=Natronobacterium haloterrestre TaxID=148448 RepID=A0A1I1LI86_NATHA|nr:helix-turn-helix domain-containing protein [Halobiforma haloterrestris]SFC69200.1 Predicted DNA binding protein, contains HTH domain [Halobiforma haloterrestris]
MLRSTVQLDLDSDYVLNDVTQEFDVPLVVTREEIHEDGTLTFVVEIPEHRDEIASRLRESDAVRRVGTVGDSTILVRKQSCGAIGIIRKHNGMLVGVDRAFRTERTFDMMAFSREDVKRIVEDLGDLGTASVERLVRVPDRPAGLSKRQYEVVEAALEAGYYDWPRETDAESVAEGLGITHPTFLEHLRKAEKKLLERAVNGRSTDQLDEQMG